MEGYQRLGRRLREHHERLGQAVGTSAEGLTLLLFEAWDDSIGRLRVLKVAGRRAVSLDVTRKLAAAVLGKDWNRGRETWPPGEIGTVFYLLPLDRAVCQDFFRPPQWTPLKIRWFDARALAQGMGDDNGFCTWDGGDYPFAIPGTQIVQLCESIERRRTLIRQDMKREMRMPEKKRRRREAAIERACEYLVRAKKTCVQQWAAAIVRKAIQTRCGTIRVMYAKPALDFAWAMFFTALDSCAKKYAGLAVIVPKATEEAAA